MWFAVILVAVWLLARRPATPAEDSTGPAGSNGQADLAADLATPQPAAVRRPRQPASAPTEAMQSDRLEWFLYRARGAREAERFGAMFARLDGARRLLLSSPRLLAVRDRFEAQAARDLAMQVAELVELVTVGRVLQARRRLALLRDPPHARVERALAAAVAERGWQSWSAIAKSGGQVPVPRSLSAGRLVGLVFRDEWVRGRVVASGEEVTVEVPGSAGPAFAFVERAALQPVQPTIEEAVDQARAARRGGDAVLAALWLSHCQAAGAAADPCVRELAAQLR